MTLCTHYYVSIIYSHGRLCSLVRAYGDTCTCTPLLSPRAAAGVPPVAHLMLRLPRLPWLVGAFASLFRTTQILQLEIEPSAHTDPPAGPIWWWKQPIGPVGKGFASRDSRPRTCPTLQFGAGPTRTMRN